MEVSLRLDAIDRQIIALLRQNARRSFNDVGAQVGLSAPAVKRRVDRLERAGVIIGYTAVLDPSAEGATTEAFVELYCVNRTNPEEIREAAAAAPRVVAAYTVTGEADALLRTRTADIAELERTLELIRAHRNTERTKSIVVLSRLFERDVIA
jgi:DNA-binding Lrp family transcriptional regulator